MFQGFVPKAAVFVGGASGKRSDHGDSELIDGFTASMGDWKMAECQEVKPRWREIPEGQLLSLTYPLLGSASQ